MYDRRACWLLVGYWSCMRDARGSPLLDLRFLRVPTFQASVLGGSLFRIGLGRRAVPAAATVAGRTRDDRLQVRRRLPAPPLSAACSCARWRRGCFAGSASGRR